MASWASQGETGRGEDDERVSIAGLSSLAGGLQMTKGVPQ